MFAGTANAWAGDPARAEARAEWDRAHAFYERTQYRESLTALGAAGNQGTSSKDARTLQLIGQDYFMLGDFKKATAVLEKAVALAPHDAIALHWLGRAYGRRAEAANPFSAPGYATKSRECFEKAVAMDPSDHDAMDDLFDFYLQAPGFLGGGLHKAQQVAERVAQRDPAQGQWALAQIDEKRKEYRSAEQHLRMAIKLAPQQVSRVVALAKCLANQGRVNESEAMFDQAMKMAPQNPIVLFERAETYIHEQRQLGEAKELLEQYLQEPLTPDDPPRQQAEALLKKIGA